ncbi:DNA-directed RNA polymerase subunit delta [Lysinibacillus telephonicus]|uniref:DNA-directed RNA polymerase subunit delta n=1 Tax=Lysinibacillus telephonicus TaxID=1714840 RepID=UPI00163A3845|nr:DNA-directed RNA polymerase subunit delta [Lysinibacillus telephonicus]
MNIREMTQEQLAEESLIDLAYAILEERKSPIAFHDLLKEIQNLNGLSDEEIQSRLVQFYTDMNIEGRFLLNHENTWGLREWYKIETIEEETAPTVKARKRKKAVLEDDEEELIVDEEDLVFEEDFDEFVEDDLEDDDLDDEDDLDFVEEEIDSIDEVDVDVDADIDDELIEEEDGFIIDDEEEEDDLLDEEDED